MDLQVQLQERRLANTLGYTKMNDEVRNLLDTIKSGDITADELIGKLGISESNIEDLKEFQDLIRQSFLQEKQQVVVAMIFIFIVQHQQQLNHMNQKYSAQALKHICLVTNF